MLFMRWVILIGMRYEGIDLISLKPCFGNLFVCQQILDLAFDHLSCCLLFFRMIEDCGGVLRSSVVTLSVQSGRVMEGEKELDQLLVFDLF